MDQLATDAFKAALGAGPVGGLLFYFLWGTKNELATARAKIDQLQGQIVDMMKSQLESEPSRRETLSKLTRLVEDQTVLLKERLTP